MNLNDIQNGARVLLGANIVLYALQYKSKQCRDLLLRCASRAVEGILPVHTLAEISHLRMMLEAQSKGLIASNPGHVRQLAIYAEDMRRLLEGDLTLLSIETEDFYVALEIQRQFGLLTNDSLFVAVARRTGTNQVATADATLDSVQGLIVYKPDDLTLL